MNNRVESKLTEKQRQIISQLTQLLRNNGEIILAGKTKLALTSVALNCVNEGFSHIIEGDLNDSFDVLQTNNFKASVYQDLQFLYDFVQKTLGLKITHGSTTLQGNVDISKFRSLQVLELKKIPLHLVIGLQSLTTQLKTIIISRCLNCLEDLFLRCGGDMSETYSWPELKVADISFNCIEELDPSLKLLPRIEALNLSHNFIKNTEHLEHLKGLHYLNLSYNLLENIPKLYSSTKTTLRFLAIRNNNLENLEGIEELINLEDLDVSYNCLTQHKVLTPLRNLKKLFKIWLEGNPLSFHAKHRKLCIEHLSPEAAHEKFQLDGKGFSKSELQLKKIQMVEPKILSIASNSHSKVDPKSTSINLGPNDVIVHAENISSSFRDSSKFSEGPESYFNPSVSSDSSFKKKKKRIREVKDIVDNEDADIEQKKSPEDAYHLQTKEKLEEFRRQRGANWLVASRREGVIKVETVANEAQQASEPDVIKRSDNDNFLSSCDTVKNTDVERLHSSFEILPEEIETKPSEKQTSCISLEINDTKIIEDQNDTKFIEDQNDTKFIEDQDDTTDTSRVTYTSSLATFVQESSSDDEQNKEGQTFIVQLERENRNILLLLVVDDQFIKEKDFRDGRTLERLDLRSLLQIEKIPNKDISLSTVQLTFDFIRKDRRKRTYVFNDDSEGFQNFLKLLEPALEARALNDMMKGALQCLKCSAQFSKEVAKLKLQKNKKSVSGTVISLKQDSTQDDLCEVPACPNCNSEMVVELDEAPVPKARGIGGRSSSSSETTPHGSPRPSNSNMKKKTSEQKSRSRSEANVHSDRKESIGSTFTSKHSSEKLSPNMDISPPQHSSTPSTGSGLIEWQQKRGQMELLMRQELFSTSNTVTTNKITVPKLEEKDYKDVQNNKLKKLTSDKVPDSKPYNKCDDITENVHLTVDCKIIDYSDACGSSNNTNESFYSAFSKVADTSDTSLSKDIKEIQTSQECQISPTVFSGGMRRSESDITILSNPSQSSIAVISTPSVDQIGFDSTLEPIKEIQRQFSAPSSPIFNQMYYTPSSPVLERSLSVGDGEALLPKHNGMSPNLRSKHFGLLDGSSSGSTNGSISTAFENAGQNKAVSNGKIQSDETSDYEDFLTPRKNSDPSSKSSEKTLSNKSSDKTLSHHSSEKVEVTDDNLSISKYKSLHNFIKSEEEKEINENGSNSNQTKSIVTSSNLIHYSYDDFTRIDHRIQLFLDLIIFEDNEDFASLLKAGIITSSKLKEFSGLFVISSKYIHLLKIEEGQNLQEEIDEPSKWLVSVEKKSLSDLKEIKLLLSNQGLLFVFDSSLYIVLLRDADRCNCYISYISGFFKDESVSIETVAEEMLDNLKMELLELHPNRDKDEALEIKLFIMGHWRTKIEDNEVLEPILLLITEESVILASENYQWLISFCLLSANIPSLQIIKQQKIIDLVGVETFDENPTELLLHFLDEDKREECQWPILLETEISLQTIIAALRGPWENLFGVDLTIIPS